MKIGNVEIGGRVFLAPMAGVTDRAFREICVQLGAGLVVSEMVSAKAILYKNAKTLELLAQGPLPCPFSVQLFGDDPETLASAAEIVAERKPDIIDINMGCPAPKISSNGCGAALMRNPHLCGEIVRAVRQRVNIPITVKIRKGWNSSSVNAVEVAKTCEENGASAIAIHGRTKTQMYEPHADWDIIRDVKQAVSIPVIGNGDITDCISAKNMLDDTSCDAVMIGRAALGNPWIFAQSNAYIADGKILASPTLEQRLDVMAKHVELACRYKGEHIGVRESRKHIGWYLKGFPGAASFRKAAFSLETIDQFNELCQAVRDFASAQDV